MLSTRTLEDNRTSYPQDTVDNYNACGLLPPPFIETSVDPTTGTFLLILLILFVFSFRCILLKENKDRIIISEHMHYAELHIKCNKTKNLQPC